MTAKYPGTAIGGRPIGTAYGVSKAYGFTLNENSIA